MRRVETLYRSSVGKKVAMAVTGVFVVGWLAAHMTGNLKAFLGAEALNHYAEWLKEMGAPVLPHGTGLWGTRILLLAAIAIHITAALQLWAASRAARPEGYRKEQALTFTFASRTMRWGGVFLLVYLVYHIFHMTVGSAHSDFVAGDVYHNVVSAFQNPVVFGVYALAMVFLGLHLYHGVWSLFQTLGLSHPRFNRFRRPLSAFTALFIAGGFLLVPVAVITGILS